MVLRYWRCWFGTLRSLSLIKQATRVATGKKNKLVFFRKKTFFFSQKNSPKKTGQNFVFFIFKHLFTLYCFLNYKKWLTVLILCLGFG